MLLLTTNKSYSEQKSLESEIAKAHHKLLENYSSFCQLGWQMHEAWSAHTVVYFTVQQC